MMIEAREVIWIRRIYVELTERTQLQLFKRRRPTIFLIDNTALISISRQEGTIAGTKHMYVRFHHIK